MLDLRNSVKGVGCEELGQKLSMQGIRLGGVSDAKNRKKHRKGCGFYTAGESILKNKN